LTRLQAEKKTRDASVLPGTGQEILEKKGGKKKKKLETRNNGTCWKRRHPAQTDTKSDGRERWGDKLKKRAEGIGQGRQIS